jgi:hypothetical protein
MQKDYDGSVDALSELLVILNTGESSVYHFIAL